MKNNKALVIAGICVFFLGVLGLFVGPLFSSTQDEFWYWAALCFACLCSYNIAAFLFHWTMFFGAGGTIDSTSSNFDSVGGVSLAGGGVIASLIWWISQLM